MVKGFHLKATDEISFFKIPKYVEKVLILRRVFSSHIVLCSFSGDDTIKISDKVVGVLSKFEIEHNDILGKLADDHWRLNLVLISPHIGGKFIKLWDAGCFDVICRD